MTAARAYPYSWRIRILISAHRTRKYLKKKVVFRTPIYSSQNKQVGLWLVAMGRSCGRLTDNHSGTKVLKWRPRLKRRSVGSPSRLTDNILKHEVGGWSWPKIVRRGILWDIYLWWWFYYLSIRYKSGKNMISSWKANADIIRYRFDRSFIGKLQITQPDNFVLEANKTWIFNHHKITFVIRKFT